jgi:hypothetical protein
MDDPEFIARVVSHIPAKGQVTERYCNRCTNSHREKVWKASLAAFPLPIAKEDLGPIRSEASAEYFS